MCGNDFLQASHLCSFPLCFHLVAHLEAIGIVPCKRNKVMSQALPLSWRAGRLPGANRHLFIVACAECLTWMDKQFGLFSLFTYVGVSCVFLFFLHRCYSIAIQERVCQILYVLPLTFEFYTFRRANMD